MLALLKTYLAHFIAVVAVLSLAFVGYKFYRMNQILTSERAAAQEQYDKLIDTQQKYVQLTKDVAQLKTSYKSQRALKSQVGKKWKEVKLAKKEKINSEQSQVITVTNTKTIQKDSDYSFLSPDAKKGYVINELRIAGKDSPPIGYVLVKKTGEVEKDNYSFQLKLDSVQIQDAKTGKVRVVSKAYLVPQENGLADTQPTLKKWKGQEYALPVTGGEVSVDPKEKVITKAEPENYLKDAAIVAGTILSLIIFKVPLPH
jgi:hypothetical protein